jgi:hypothetical protein
MLIALLKKYRRKIDDEKFEALVMAGATPKQIGIELGVSKQAVSQRAMALGLAERLRDNKPPRKAKEPAVAKPRKTNPLAGPLRAFRVQQSGAAERGIGWELSFEQWWELWKDKYHLRGRTKGCLVMCRTGDKGPYAVGNVRIATIKENAQECALEKMTKSGRRMSARQFVGDVPGSVLSRHGVFRQYQEDA